MGCLLRWKIPDTEATYTLVRIYRATSEAGTYTLLASQTITDNTYYDATGSTTMWYKILFTDGTNNSAYSDAVQGGTYVMYCTVDDVRQMTNITSSDLSDTQIADLIVWAGTQLNADIHCHWIEEQLQYIDNTRENEINSTNTTYYTLHFPIGDLNDDMAVTTADVEVYLYDSNCVRTVSTVSSITPDDGKFVLSSAPGSTSNKVTVTYRSCQRSVHIPDPLIKMACAVLAAAWGYSKINVGKAPQFKMGSTAIWRDMKAFDTLYKRYLALVAQINNRSMVERVFDTNIV